MDVDADDGSQLDEFDDIDAALTALDIRDEGLVPAKPARGLALGQARTLAILN